MPPVIPRAIASGSTISIGDAETIQVSRPADVCCSSNARASGRMRPSNSGSTISLSARRSTCLIPPAAARMRSRTLVLDSSLEPKKRNFKAFSASPAKSCGRIWPASYAARANTNAEEPAISVRSRSKNAAVVCTCVIFVLPMCRHAFVVTRELRLLHQLHHVL